MKYLLLILLTLSAPLHATTLECVYSSTTDVNGTYALKPSQVTSITYIIEGENASIKDDEYRQVILRSSKTQVVLITLTAKEYGFTTTYINIDGTSYVSMILMHEGTVTPAQLNGRCNKL